MKLITHLLTSLLASSSLSLADGIPVDRKTGKVDVEHTIVPLTAEQVEETQTLGTFTLTPEQWRGIRAISPGCPKRFNTILPVTWSDCTCCVGDGSRYVIALSRDRIAVLHDEDSGAVIQAVRYQLYDSRRVITLRVNERGEFHLGGILVPFPTLLEAFASPLEGLERDEKGRLRITVGEDGIAYTCTPGLDVELPMGSKPADAVFSSRLKQVAAAANRIGFRVLFLNEGSGTDQ